MLLEIKPVDWLSLLNLAVTFYMLGLIWIVQLIHYPSFMLVDQSQFAAFHDKHSQALGLLAGPAMILELILSVLLFWREAGLLTAVLVGLTIALWISTFFLSVPLHNRLASGYSKVLIVRLVQTNWVRTILWSVKAGVSVLILIS